MSLTIQTNVASLNAQRQLAMSHASLATSMQRLSSGLRVNGAKDDAAGLAIAERMGAQVRGMNVAVRNANDGISLAQTAEGSLNKVGDALQRMRELAVQARNATNSSSDKDSLDKEFGELAKEIQRVLGGTKFNGKAILGADAGTMSFQVGAGVGTNDTIELSLTNLLSSSAITALTGAAPVAVDAADITAANAAAKAAATASYSSQGGPLADSLATLNDGYWRSATTAGEAAARALETPMTGGNGYTVSAAEAATASVLSATTASEARARGLQIAIEQSFIPSAQQYMADAAEAAFAAFAAIVPPQPGAASIGSGSDATAIATVIGNLDTAIDEINSQRSTFGATLSRFDSVVATLNVSIENQSAARGRIMDADFATETANLSRAQILQQAGNAMVAQANQLPQSVMQLLR